MTETHRTENITLVTSLEGGKKKFQPINVIQVHVTTRMHSSRMRTVRCSSRLLGGGGLSACHGVCPGGCRVCLPEGGLPAGEGGCLPRGLPARCEIITIPQLLLRTIIIE